MKIEFETRCDYLDSLGGYYPEDFILDEYKSYLLSIEDMRAVFAQREKDICHVCYDIDLIKDKKTGLLYTDYDFIKERDLLVGHLLIEQLYAKKDQVDWARVTYNYDYEAIERIKHMLITPLVWVPTEEAAEYCVVSGKVAKEIDTPVGYENEDRYQFCRDLSAQGILWFADNLPEYTEQTSLWRYHHMLPKIVLWDRLLQSSFKHFRSEYMIQLLKYIANERGVARVVEIVDRFRKDWPYIEKKGLFGITGLSEFEKKTVLYNKEAFFDEIGLHIAEWESEEAKNAEQNSQRGPKVTTLFKDRDIAESETDRFLSFINRHKMNGDDVDSSYDNRVNQVAVCFFRIWKEKKCLMSKASGTSLSRFIIENGLSLSVKEKAHGNALNRMINSDDVFSTWIGDVRASFSK